MPSRFTEQDTEAFYDAEDAIYRSFWDEQGSLHWGYFDGSASGDFLKACANLNEMMVEKARIDVGARVLDLGCGNGTTAMWLGRSRGCSVVGIDLSPTRIDNAKQALQEEAADLRTRMDFEQGSATELPFPDNSFSHIWSQATIYHVHNKEKALGEACRVLDNGGLLVFDDLTKPRPDISDDARTYVYDRLLFDTDFSFDSYQTALRQAGFQVIEAIDLSSHLRTSYQCLARLTETKGDALKGKYRELAYAYGHMVRAVDHGELGWGFFVCKK